MKIPKKRTRQIAFKVMPEVKEQWDYLQLYAKQHDDDLASVIHDGLAAILRAAAKQLGLNIKDRPKLTTHTSAPTQAINGGMRHD